MYVNQLLMGGSTPFKGIALEMSREDRNNLSHYVRVGLAHSHRQIVTGAIHLIMNRVIFHIGYELSRWVPWRNLFFLSLSPSSHVMR